MIVLHLCVINDDDDKPRVYRAAGARAPLDFQLFNFLVTSEPHKL